MKSVHFPQANCRVAENQDEYKTLITNIKTIATMEVEVGDQKLELPYKQMVCCFELSEEELRVLNHTGKLYYTQIIGIEQVHPMSISVINPLSNEEETPE